MSSESSYRDFLKLSQQMLAAGQNQDWDALVDLERQRSVLQAKLPASVAQDEAQAVVELIRQIQQCDTELKERVDTWMKHVRILLRMDTNPTPEP